MQIPGLRGIGLGTLAKRSVAEFLEDDMATYAAALAYQVLLSLFPFVIFLIALLSFLQIPSFFDWLLDQARAVLPEQAMSLVGDVVGEVQNQREGGLLSLGIIGAIWIASAGVRSTMNALNAAYDVGEGRPAWRRYSLSIVYTFGLALMVVLAIGLMLIGPQLMGWIAERVGMGQMFVTLWAWLRLPVATVLLMLAVAIIYYFAPNVDHRFRFITPGSVVAVFVWLSASLGFSYYVTNFANYSATYGSIGAIIVLLLYFFISSAVLLFGAEINGVIEHHARQGRPPREQEPSGEQ